MNPCFVLSRTSLMHVHMWALLRHTHTTAARSNHLYNTLRHLEFQLPSQKVPSLLGLAILTEPEGCVRSSFASHVPCSFDRDPLSRPMPDRGVLGCACAERVSSQIHVGSSWDGRSVLRRTSRAALRRNEAHGIDVAAALRRGEGASARWERRWDVVLSSIDVVGVRGMRGGMVEVISHLKKCLDRPANRWVVGVWLVSLHSLK